MQHPAKWNTTNQILKATNIKLRDINGLASSQIKKMSDRCRSQDLGKKTIFAPSVVGKCSFIGHKLIFAAWLGTKIAIFVRGLGIVQSSYFVIPYP